MKKSILLCCLCFAGIRLLSQDQPLPTLPKLEPTPEYFSAQLEQLSKRLEIFKTLSQEKQQALLNNLALVYRNVYKADLLERNKADMRWINFDFHSNKTAPVFLLDTKQQLKKVIELAITKLKASSTFWKPHIEWLESIAFNLSNMKKSPHIYDHYYSFPHHILKTLFSEHKPTMFSFLPSERVTEELIIMKNNLAKILATPKLYNTTDDFIRTVRKYVDAHPQGPDDPIAEYRWYGPKPRTPESKVSYSKITTDKLEQPEVRKKYLQELLQTIEIFMTNKNKERKTEPFLQEQIEKIKTLAQQAQSSS